MQHQLVAIARAVGLFVGTNLDDMMVLAVLNMSSRASGSPSRWQIWVGQFIGVVALVIVSLLASLSLSWIPARLIGLLGLIPLSMGVRKLVGTIAAREPGDRDSPAAATGLTRVIGLTVSNGGDNIAVYTPIFRSLGAGDLAATIAVFMCGVAAWCAVGERLASHRLVTSVGKNWGQWIVPAVYIVIGLYVTAGGHPRARERSQRLTGW